MKRGYGDQLDAVYGDGFLSMNDDAVDDMIIYNRDLHLVDFLRRCFNNGQVNDQGPTFGLVSDDAVAKWVVDLSKVYHPTFRAQNNIPSQKKFSHDFLGTYAVVDGHAAFVGAYIYDDMDDSQLLHYGDYKACVLKKESISLGGEPKCKLEIQVMLF